MLLISFPKWKKKEFFVMNVSQPAPTSPVDASTVIPALRSLARGQQVVYYRGHLAADKRNILDAPLLGTVAYDLYRAGKVHLTQRRIGRPYIRQTPTGPVETSHGFEYIATGA